VVTSIRPAGSAPEGFTGRLATIFRAANRSQPRDLLFPRPLSSSDSCPCLPLSGVEGHIFGPMAKTYAYGPGGRPAGDLHNFASSVRPAVAGPYPGDRDARRPVAASALHGRCLSSRWANRVVTLSGAALLLALAIVAGRSLGLEFLPHLEEGNLWIRATMPSSVLARGGQRLRQPNSAGDQGLSGG